MKETDLWSYSVNNNEYFNGGICQTRKGAIKNGIKDIRERQIIMGTLYIGKVNYFVPTINADLILDTIAQDASDEAGEFTDGYLDNVNVEHVNELQEMMQKAYEKWENKHPEYMARFYLVTETEELDIEELLRKEGIMNEPDGKYGISSQRE